ncbi:MAG TPA: segregation/condensation protein A [Myxococcota bacterium]|nr:segregation/condensation protein A [Myxococcota bacterium]
MNDHVDLNIASLMASVELASPLVKIRARGKFRDEDALDFIPTPESVHFYVDTPNFDGPLDLLLHLIRKHSMDIFDIPIVMITQKYLAALDQMLSLNLDVAGEFLVMAATLMEIKSKMLLPKDEILDEETEEEAVDPRLELMKRLLEYQSFKEASLELAKLPQLGRDVFLRPEDEEDLSEQASITTFKDLAPMELFDLIEILSKVIKKSEHLSIHTITRDRISVAARVHELIEFSQVRVRFSFYDALRYFPIYEKVDVIVTFLALLELSRLKLIKIEAVAREDLMMSLVKENFYSKQKEILQTLKTREEVSYD